MRYRSKPSEVEAIQWDGAKWTADDMRDAGVPVRVLWVGDHYQLELRAGKGFETRWVHVSVGDWVARHPDDPADYWLINAGAFANKYEPVDVEDRRG